VTPHSRFVATKRDSHYETILPIYPNIILKKPINPYMNFAIPIIVEKDAYKLKFASKLPLLPLHNKRDKVVNSIEKTILSTCAHN
jgi:hypothetical protein